ncbi:MAG: 2-dehydropantoate 2-reductase N-terminal domain-containing protein, partial [Anaerolineae bacterium]|nr:hypothetical protein [Thermoflexales bacterium]MDW8408993.1 2-dehydropantoate 2-reductase N-terminal domain-containing protein [Anaerolineae bacterium]
MKILVIGAGAVGSWIGGHLARSGQWVTCVARPPFIHAARESGLHVEYASGQAWSTRNFYSIASLADLASVDNPFYAPPYDAVLICVKAYDVETVVQALRETERVWSHHDGAGIPRTALVTFQNGVGSEERVAEAFGFSRVIAGTLTTPVAVAAPAAIKQTRLGGGIGLAPCAGSVPDLSPRAVETALRQSALRQTPLDPLVTLFDAFRQTLLPVEMFADYRAMKWSKLLLNSVANASSAILDRTPAQIYADPRLFALEMQMLRETLAVTHAAGIHIVNLPGMPAAWLARLVRYLPDRLLRPILRRLVARGRGDKMPSFYYDVPRSSVSSTVSRAPAQASEVRWLNGAVAAWGQRLGVPTPVNAALTRVLDDLVLGRETAAD